MVANAKDMMMRVVTGCHQAVFQLSQGRLANRGYGMPVLQLTTTGRKSGKRRTTMLTSPVQDGDRIVVVASNGGDDRQPTRFLNMRDDPKVEVMMGGETRTMRAPVATPGEEAVLWPHVVAAHRWYAQDQQRTDRDIPLVILEP